MLFVRDDCAEASALTANMLTNTNAGMRFIARSNTELSSERAAEQRQQKEADARRLLK
jgi:hypothetical protein